MVTRDSVTRRKREVTRSVVRVKELVDVFNDSFGNFSLGRKFLASVDLFNEINIFPFPDFLK